MENNNKRNSEIFLGIVGVATLIVAIIGASFSYFVASAGSAEGAVDLTAYEFNASLSLQPIYASDAKMIPVDPEGIVSGADEPNNTNLAYALNVAKKCTDDHGFKVCALYELTITNNGSEAVTLQGTIVTEENNGFQNLMYRPVTKSGDVYSIGSSATGLSTVVGGSINIDEITVAANGGVETVYALVYLNETGLDEEPQSSEMGATYKGKFVFTSTASNDSKLTGTFTVNNQNNG